MKIINLFKKTVIPILLIIIFGCSQTVKKDLEPKKIEDKPINEKALNYFSLGDFAEMDGDLIGALHFYELAEEYDKESVVIKEKIINSMFQLIVNDRVFAKTLIEKAEEYINEQNVQSPVIYDYLSSAYYIDKRYNESVLALEKKVDLDPTAESISRLFFIKAEVEKKEDYSLLFRILKFEKTREDLILFIISKLNYENKDAFKFIDKSYERYENPEIYDSYLSYLKDKNNYEEIENLFSYLVKKDRKMSLTFAFNAIYSYFKEDKHKEIIKYRKTFYSFENVQLDQYVLNAYIMNDDTKNAVYVLKRLVKYPALTAEDLDRYNAFLANYLFELGEVKESAEIFSKVQDFNYIRSFINQEESSDLDKLNSKLIDWFSELESLKYDINDFKILKSRFYYNNGDLENAKLWISELDYSGLDDQELLFLVTHYIQLNEITQAELVYSEIHDQRSSMNFFASMFFDSLKDEENCERFLVREIEQDGANAVDAYLMYSNKLELSGKTQDAIDILKQGLKKYPDDPNIQNGLGYVLVLYSDELDYAEELINKALSSVPEAVHILDSMSWLHFTKGNYQKALEYMKKPLEDGISNSTIAYHVAEIYLQLGNLEEAKKYYTLCIELSTEDDAVEKALKALDENFNGEKMERFVFNKYNIITFIIALAVMILGYIVMGSGDKTFSVILLILSYVVLFPLSIVIGFVMGEKNNRK